MVNIGRRWGWPALRHAALPFAATLLCAFAAQAQNCNLPDVPRPADFPDQPINIFIPRSSNSGSLGLSQKIAEAIEALKDKHGNPLGLRVNTLFKFGGDMNVALDYFNGLPPNGYNVIQLMDTYSSLLASSADEGNLVPISMAQVTFSQLYIRADDTRFSDLGSFLDYAANSAKGSDPVPLRVALFGAAEDRSGQENILLRKFIANYGTNAVADTSVAPTIVSHAFESGSERYFSLFSQSSDQRSDALIEQPGDVAQLISGGLLKPIFTFLPQQDLNPEISARLKERLGQTASFPDTSGENCRAYYRYRGFFIPKEVPADRRQFLEWVFRKAVDSVTFREFNHDEYMDVLYFDRDILDSYCTTGQLNEFFQDSIRDHRACISGQDTAKVAG